MLSIRSVFFVLIFLLPMYIFSQVYMEENKQYSEGLNFLHPEENIIPEITTPWNQIIKVSGYVQVRYNELFQTNPDLSASQADESWGGHKGVSIRRMRVKFSGQLNEYVYFYIQTDFGGGRVSLRDAYMDLALDKKREYRFRIGQSKVPYSFENLQSSQDRLSLDRNDPLNSAVRNERDLGVFFFWTPKEAQERYSFLVKSRLKGSGNYGVFAFGFFNGQIANSYDFNANKHFVARLNYPFKFENGQILEMGINAYTGKHVLMNVNDGLTVNNNVVIGDDEPTTSDREFLDERAGASFVLYPQPIGFQVEYNLGRGPEFNPENKSVEVQNLQGGYAMLFSRFSFAKNHIFFPFIKYQYYDGGKKQEIDARSYLVKDLEMGIEWQPNLFFELNLTYTISDRKYLDFENLDKHEKGQLLRIQAQVNF